MSKFKKKLVGDIRQEQETAIQQESLRQQHGIQDENVIVVEKSNMVKFMIRQLSAIIKFVATTMILVLAAIGLLSIIYPNIRSELLTVLLQYYNSLKLYFSM